ncbi:MAG: FAD-binding oxidoreductase, partial [Armatimonadetes bacterium]|nr:FAD-binding oxidoreductase [Armatimonadota bacterium]
DDGHIDSIQYVTGRRAADRHGTRFLLNTETTGIRQDALGHFFLGFTNEHVGCDTRTTWEGIRKIVGNAVRKVPSVATENTLRVCAGVRSMPADGLPCLDPVPAVKGFYTAVSHSGVTLSPMHGIVIADVICDGATAQLIGPWPPGRHHVQERPRPSSNA